MGGAESAPGRHAPLGDRGVKPLLQPSKTQGIAGVEGAFLPGAGVGGEEVAIEEVSDAHADVV